jgi:hypothetical protein
VQEPVHLKLSDVLSLLTEDERTLPIEALTGWECDSVAIVAAAIVGEMLDTLGRVVTPRCIMLFAGPLVGGKVRKPWDSYPIERVLVSGEVVGA